MHAVRPRPTSTIFGLIAALLLGTAAWAGVARVTDVRLWAGPEGTRLVLDVSGPVEYDVFTLDNPDRVVVDLANAELRALKGLPSGQGPVKKVRSGPQPGHGLRLVLDVDSAQLTKSFMVGPDGAAGHRLVVELPGAAGAAGTGAAGTGAAGTGAAGAGAAGTGAAGTGAAGTGAAGIGAAGAAPAPVPAPVTAAAVPTPANSGQTAANTTVPAYAPNPQQVLLATADVAAAVAGPLSNPVKSQSSVPKGRDLVIAIDAGHGGQDPGAIGRGGTREKDVTLAIAKRLAAAINAEEGMRAVLIRDGDYFITLGGRTRKARQLGADMFVSVHADSVRNREVSGSSVYVLSLRGASDEAARWLAESENAADLKGGVSLDVKDDVLASVLLDVTQKEAVSDSVEAADNVLVALRGAGKVHGSRVRHAGFIVLKSPDIPSMLVETAFISNASDERRLRSTDEQQRIATAIRVGIRNYWHDNAPPGTRLAALIAARRNNGTPNTTLAER